MTVLGVDKHTPASPSDFHPREFRIAEWWREEADKWEALANRADDEDNCRDAAFCKIQAVGCRHNARVLELAADRHSDDSKKRPAGP